MQAVNIRTANKNMSRSKRSILDKNQRRIEAAINNDIESFTYGKITKALGNKMFTIINTSGREHLSHIRGKMSRVTVGDVVLLNIRDFESRGKSINALYDIMAVFSSKDASRLVKNREIPHWMTNNVADITESKQVEELFYFEDDSDDDVDVENI